MIIVFFRIGKKYVKERILMVKEILILQIVLVLKAKDMIIIIILKVLKQILLIL